MRDVMSLAETLTQAQERGEDMGDYGVLCRYQQRRQSDREATIGVTDSLVHLCQPLDAAGCRAQHRADDDGIIYPGTRCAGAAHSWLGGALKAVLRNKQCKVLM